MKVWMTKVWGFGEPVGPLQFSTEGWRSRAREQLKDGGYVVLVGTKGTQTRDEEQNAILGMMEPTTEPVMALDYLTPRGPEDLNDLGQYKWPFGLLNKAAWRFDEPRARLADVSHRAFSMDSAQGIVRLTDEEAARVLALPRTPVSLAQSIEATARIEGDSAARRRGAPPPTTSRRGVMHMRRAPAFTYALAISRTQGVGRADLHVGFKIGWAFDWEARMRTFNHTAMPLLGGLRYAPRLKQLWPTAMAAYRMERAVLGRFNNARHRHNHEIITDIAADALDLGWASCLVQVKRRG